MLYTRWPASCSCWWLIYNGWYGQKLAQDWEQWTIAEWLISYAPGFVRRGLSGEILLFISRYSGWPANQVALGVLAALFAVFFVLFAVLLRGKRMTFWYFVLCLSPGFVLFTFYNSSAVGRKESLVFVAFTLWAILSAGWRKGVLFHVLFGVASLLLTLMHEMFFFFTPYLVLLSYLVTKQRGGDGEWMKSFVVPACSGLALLSLLQFSASLNDPALCNRLVGLGAPARVCGGVLEYDDRVSPMEALKGFLARRDTADTVGRRPCVRRRAGAVLPVSVRQQRHPGWNTWTDRNRSPRDRLLEPAVHAGGGLGAMDLDSRDSADDHLRGIPARARRGATGPSTTGHSPGSIFDRRPELCWYRCLAGASITAAERASSRRWDR